MPPEPPRPSYEELAELVAVQAGMIARRLGGHITTFAKMMVHRTGADTLEPGSTGD
ncbi:MAG TPA: hypothetical protein VFB74_36010 [Kribbellaceae bacterium]|nr:hypothetical protein [Kribbellaceae bacterium]